MFKTISVDYDYLCNNETHTINYLTKKSDSFSLSVTIKKPYSQHPPVFNYDTLLQPFVIKYILDRKDWPVDFLTRRKHQIMIMCHSSKESREALLQLPNVFLNLESEKVEDICFYRSKKIWFATISHERMAFMINPTAEDLSFFGGKGTVGVNPNK